MGQEHKVSVEIADEKILCDMESPKEISKGSDSVPQRLAQRSMFAREPYQAIV